MVPGVTLRSGMASGLVALIVIMLLVRGARVGPVGAAVIVVAVLGVCLLALTRRPPP